MFSFWRLTNCSFLCGTGSAGPLFLLQAQNTLSSPWKWHRSRPPVWGLSPGCSGFLICFSTGPCTQ